MAVKQMILGKSLKPIDRRHTVRNAKKFFRESYPRYLNMVGVARTYISSPNFDPTGVSAHGGLNRIEDQRTRDITAKNVVDAVIKAISLCNDGQRKKYKTILIERYCNEKDDLAISLDIDYSYTAYNYKKKEALVQFAEIFDHLKSDFNIDEEIDDLTVYKK